MGVTLQGRVRKVIVRQMAVGFLLTVALSAHATTYYWKGVNYVSTGSGHPSDLSKGYGAWDELSSWSIESETGADATALPGYDDELTIKKDVEYVWRHLDLKGQEWTIGGIRTNVDWSRHYWRFINGTLHWARDKITHSDTFHLDSGMTFVFDAGSTYTAAEGCTAGDEWFVHSGAELTMLGTLRVYSIQVSVENGGSVTLAPASLGFYNNTAQASSIRNNGILEVPNGFSFSTGSTSSGASFSIQQESGTLVLGGALSKNGQPGVYSTTLSGGTVRATGDVSFDLDAVTVPAAASIVLSVDAGSSIDLSSASFGAGASIAKRGAGDFLFTNGMSLPDTFTVEEGALLLSASGGYDLSGVTFAGGGVKIGASVVTLSAWDASLATATFAVADGFLPDSGATVLTCADASILALAQAGLNASLAGTGLTVEVSGASLVAESHYTFSSSSVTDMNDAAGWLNNLPAPAGQPAAVSGASTAAVMDGSVPAYSAISVEDGATLTVAATRNLPVTTLTGGTTLAVVNQADPVQNYGAVITSTAVKVGTMTASHGITELTDITGALAGRSWNGDRTPQEVLVKTIDEGASIHVQFKRWDGDHTKCAIIKMWQTDGTIFAQLVAARYLNGQNKPMFDFVNADGTFGGSEYTMASSDTATGYAVKQLSFVAPQSAPSTVTAAGDFATTGTGSVTVDVALDCVLDLSGVLVSTDAPLVKTGAGALVLGDELPTALTVSSGVLALQPYVEYDMSSVVLGAGAEVLVSINGAFKAPNAVARPNGKTIYLPDSVYMGVGTWATVGNWSDGDLPDASADVHIYGASTVLTLDDAATVLPASISVEGGATLRVLAGVTLPPLAIDATSKVVFGDNTTAVSVVLDASLTTVADATAVPVALPVLEVTTNATLNVIGGMKFKNVDVVLNGTLTRTSSGGLYFGYAESGETTYIGFHANAARITNYTMGGYASSILVCCAASGGTVYAVGPIEFKDMPTSGTHLPESGDNYWNGLMLGENNPPTAPFEVVFDNTKWNVSGISKITGGAIFRLKNGSRFKNKEHDNLYGRRFDIYESGKVVVEEGSELCIYAMGDWGSRPVNVQNSTPGGEALFAGAGAMVEFFRTTGDGTAVMTFSNAIYRIHRPSIYKDNNGTTYDYKNEPFKGLRGVTLAEGSTLTFSTCNGYYFKDSSGDRFVALADVPIAGAAGSITLSNVNVNAFGVIVQSGANTATGTAGVTAVDGKGATTLFFADGANWAGTVVAGNVALTNLTDGAAAARAAFGTLDLAVDFPLRVWKSGGAVTTNDSLKVDRFTGSGRIAVEVVGEELSTGDSFVAFKLKDGAALPHPSAHFTARLGATVDADGYRDVTFRTGRGLQIIVR
ncbi:MAG: hypothetical protein IJ829_05015 [Kiritimatiellae bacterium]|nr:hypothetical protein [Kiritimatiellia bacterium]